MWGPTTIGAILSNEKYIGVWKYRMTHRVKIPGSSKIGWRAGDPNDLVMQELPELRIIDDAVWRTVQSKREANRDRSRRRAARSSFLLSGLLRCGDCGHLMIISGNSSTRYYRCRRGECGNRLGVREEVARRGILDGLRGMLMNREILTYARERITQKLDALGGDTRAELAKHRSDLQRTEARIGRVVDYLADGSMPSTHVAAKLRALEATAGKQKAAIAELEHRVQAQGTGTLPSVDAILKAALNLDNILRGDVPAAREHLRRLFRGGKIDMEQDGKTYMAKSEVLPGMVLSFESAREAKGGQGGGSHQAPEELPAHQRSIL